MPLISAYLHVEKVHYILIIADFAGFSKAPYRASLGIRCCQLTFGMRYKEQEKRKMKARIFMEVSSIMNWIVEWK